MKLTQQAVADHLDLDRASVARLLPKLGIDPKATTLDAVRVAYIRWLRDKASGRTAKYGELDLVAERARHAAAQSTRVELQNAVTKRELAPVELLERALASVSRQLAAILEAVPGRVRQRLGTGISNRALVVFTEEINAARIAAANIKLADDPIAAQEEAAWAQRVPKTPSAA